jgi:putative DNA primase/helicase
MKTSEAARGKWRRILVALGIDSKFLDGRHHACPISGKGEDRFRFTDRDGSGSYFCACSDGRKGGIGLLECKTGKSFREVANEVDAVLGNLHELEPRQPTYAEKLRASAKTSRRSAYLESRGLEIAPGLLFSTNVEYRDDGKVVGRYPAMLAPIVKRGKFQTFHVTYLERGGKAAVPCPRKILPGGQIAGGGVALYPPAERMGIGEGIETCIAAKMLHGIPTHAALNTDMLAKWEPPSVAKIVVIFADFDRNYAGHKGAYALAHRLVLKGIQVDVRFPPEVDTDWNDFLLSQRRAA